MRIRRDRRGFNPYTWVRVALFFLAAGVWLGGAAAGNQVATGVAIGILLAAVVLGVVGRRRGGDPPPSSSL